ncbi:PucR family transcriptional regulator [Lentzea sp. HUAS12]|uniref:PucR family transcriptional regulator n=1 Tax=Lentzea sp. HUAS12 TaxID=2951806 RepID=UPI00209CB525|nr:PucR family transcriptional regulator [Lentzea sp. HUAS12]USX56606.1 helix-turn-helix domain-containing protein [Lentzea sp. HUAS12]
MEVECRPVEAELSAATGPAPALSRSSRADVLGVVGELTMWVGEQSRSGIDTGEVAALFPRLREVASRCARRGDPLPPLLMTARAELLTGLARAGSPRIAVSAAERASGRVARELFVGYHRAGDRSSALTVAVVVPQAGGRVPGASLPADLALCETLPDRLRITLTGTPAQTRALLTGSCADVAGGHWTGLAAVADDLAGPSSRAHSIALIARALGYRPGAYDSSDVLVELLASEDSRAVAALLPMIEPVMVDDVLRRTLTALVAVDGNRNLAARRLFVHRSTLDYRLTKIHALTGRHPASPRDLAVLSAAVAAHARATTASTAQSGDPA